ncbi:GNAT family N-acetyltransferase [Enterococcus sp. BWB1-3]|uniref:GNAT family N-acetyltransferase n=1 Tax=unclassified Enterococcus TaxID=2608891 RepID=UPI0019238CA7|nr:MULTISPECIES: GNAT family N-acetyltransferase [unclassified Enterococcus]MBL1227792.1 GNAT family N-acetyltransferase [Enterococcus sp. BWB1-3]MCB5952020.1 GNAT family N-acetyltransferase [Enterococcus sp. BWT-B8]
MDKEQIEITVREAVPDDAEQLVDVLGRVGRETAFLVMDGNGPAVTVEEMAHNLEDLYESPNNILMVALLGDQIVGTASVSASDKKRVEHIGEIGISILKDYWGFGLGSLMMEELIIWAKEGGIIRRLELTVQHRNIRAVQLYEKKGFITETIMPRGAKTDDGEFLDVHLMALLVD